MGPGVAKVGAENAPPEGAGGEAGLAELHLHTDMEKAVPPEKSSCAPSPSPRALTVPRWAPVPCNLSNRNVPERLLQTPVSWKGGAPTMASTARWPRQVTQPLPSSIFSSGNWGDQSQSAHITPLDMMLAGGGVVRVK